MRRKRLLKKLANAISLDTVTVSSPKKEVDNPWTFYLHWHCFVRLSPIAENFPTAIVLLKFFIFKLEGAFIIIKKYVFFDN